MEMKRSGLQIKDIGSNGVFVGYGSVFGVVDSYGDVVDHGAFAKSLARHEKNGTKPALLLFHDVTRPCGTYTHIKEDSTGLRVEGILNMNVPDGKLAYELVSSKSLTGLSIGYRPQKEGREQDGFNHLKEVDLWEISLVSLPSNEMSRIEAVKAIKTPRDLEHYLCAQGFSRNQAKGIATRGWKGHGRKDSEPLTHESIARIKAIIIKNTNAMNNTTYIS